MSLQVEATFDDKTYRHYINGFLSVMHCHHYMTLATKLCEKYEAIGGPRIMSESVEDSVRPMFDAYIKQHGISDPGARLEVAQEYYAYMGMGKMTASGDASGGEVQLTSSHVDAGWIKKWGNRDKAANYWTCGYIAAMFAAAFDKPPRSFDVQEVASIVKGDEVSKFVVTSK
jgi:hypothetical protein